MDNLVYSHSSAFNGSNKLSFSKKSLAEIKLVESSHVKQTFDNRKITPFDNRKITPFDNRKPIMYNEEYQPKSFMEEIAEQASILSPYRKLGSLKSG